MTRDDDDDGWDHDRQSLIEVIGEPKCESSTTEIEEADYWNNYFKSHYK